MADEEKKATLGQIIDGLDVRLDMNDDDLVADAIVIVKVVDGDGNVGMRTGWSPSMSWIERIGLIQVAKVIEDSDMPNGLVE